MNNPYAPPSTSEDDPKTSRFSDTTLRRIGALGLACHFAKILWEDLTDPDRGPFGSEIMAEAVPSSSSSSSTASSARESISTS